MANGIGKICGMCNSGKLQQFTDEVVPGVRVDAYKCDYCGEISYSREVMVRVEAMRNAPMLKRHFVKVGSSVAALIPSELAKKHGIKPKGAFLVSDRDEGFFLLPCPA